MENPLVIIFILVVILGYIMWSHENTKGMKGTEVRKSQISHTDRRKKASRAERAARIKRGSDAHLELSSLKAGLKEEQIMEKRQRHPLATVWLIFMLIANLLALVWVFFLALGTTTITLLPIWQYGVICMTPVLNVIAVAKMLKWNRLGFYIYCFTTVCGLILSIVLGINLLLVLLSLVGLGILYGVLQLGSPSTWEQMPKAPF